MNSSDSLSLSLSLSLSPFPIYLSIYLAYIRRYGSSLLMKYEDSGRTAALNKSGKQLFLIHINFHNVLWFQVFQCNIDNMQAVLWLVGWMVDFAACQSLLGYFILKNV